MCADTWAGAQEISVPAPVRYIYSLATRTLTLHEPLIVRLTIQNTSTDDLVADFGGDFRAHFGVTGRTLVDRSPSD